MVVATVFVPNTFAQLSGAKKSPPPATPKTEARDTADRAAVDRILANLDRIQWSDFEQSRREAAHTKTFWNLSIGSQNEAYPPRTAVDVAKFLASDDAFAISPALRKYADRVRRVVPLLGVLGDKTIYFPYVEPGIPFDLASYEEQRCFVARTMVDTVYNTLRLQAKDRAAQALANFGFPALQRIVGIFSDSDIARFAFFVTFGSKNALDNGVFATEPEVVGIVATAADVRQFSAGAITDSELLRRSAVFFSSRDAGSELRRIELAAAP
jgi:hypothetical protein